MTKRSSRDYPEASAPMAYHMDFDETSSGLRETDEEFARRLQAEEDRNLSNTSSSTHSSRSKRASVELYAKELDDHELALRLDQEARDQNIALALQTKEALRSKRRGGAVPQSVLTETSSTTKDGPKGCTKRRIGSASIILLIIGGAAFAVYRYGGTIWNKLSGNSSQQPPFYTYEEQGSLGEFNEWNNKGKGLTLSVQNGCSNDWDQYFTQAISDWSGSDALKLSTTKLNSQDLDCTAKRGKMIVCNNYFGITGWTGLNEVYFEGSKIAASVAKMNESYLNKASTSEKQYVMCHEIGHGFGLPHRDERINNPDLGTCLDYTTKFDLNKQPDEVDFQHLRDMYGTIPTRRRVLREESAHIETSLPKVSEWRYQDGRLLHQSSHHAVYENDLGDGVRVVTTLLLAHEK